MKINIELNIDEFDKNYDKQKFFKEFEKSIKEIIDLDFESYEQWYNLALSNINIIIEDKNESEIKKINNQINNLEQNIKDNLNGNYSQVFASIHDSINRIDILQQQKEHLRTNAIGFEYDKQEHKRGLL